MTMLHAAEPGIGVSRALQRAGMGAAAAAGKAQLFAAAAQVLGSEPTTGWFVPGRIEFLGKHTDYAGGRSLLCAVERGFCIVARPSASAVIRITDGVTGRQAQFPLDAALVPRAGEWTNYPMTVARRIAANFPGELHGADIVFASDLPPAAGLSSSSAFVVASFLVLCDINQLQERAEYRQSIHSIEDLCGYLGAMENGQSFGSLEGTEGVGTQGGSQDHTAILCSLAGRLVQYSFAPVRKEGAVPLPAGYTLLIASSGVEAEKAGAARDQYNRAARSVATIVQRWRAQHSGSASTLPNTLAAVVRSGPDAVQKLHAMLQKPISTNFTPQQLIDRLDQFLAESERIIPQAAAALAAGRLSELGKLVDDSQQWAQRGLANQIPETIFLAACARRLGAVAASAFGAGFGGSVWTLVRSESAQQFETAWAAAYAEQFPAAAARARYFQTLAGPPAVRVI
jgi:galactokinase